MSASGDRAAVRSDLDERFTTGLLTLRDSARYLGLPRQTFHRWARGYERGEPLLHVVPTARPREATVTFNALAEAYVLDALREAGVRPQLIRPALDELSREFGTEYVLTSRALATDGIGVLWDYSRTTAGEGLIEPGTGHFVMREIVADYLEYVSWGSDGYPVQLELRHCLPSKVSVDPYHAFGQPRFGGGARVGDVAAMLRAGESPEVVADEYGVSETDVRTAARVLLGRAA